jgi:uncharacterized protein YigE (DUF2233 family)
MFPTRFPVGRVAALVALVVGGFAIAQNTRGLRWRHVAPGLEFATMRGDPLCRRGSSTVALLRMDPHRARLRVLHYTGLAQHQPLTIAGWQRQSGALAVFNAGQYYPDYSYMGLLVSGGKVISARAHPQFRAALVAAPESGGAVARVLDLEREPLDARRPAWREVAQSFMLFDHSGTARVRRTDNVANRTVVAEDRQGRIVVATSEGGYTLWDFARVLRRAPLELSHAMAMDGGYEAELCVATPQFRYASFGRWESVADEAKVPGAQVVLPAVVAVTAR